jgi:nitrile hydratase
MDLSQVHQIHPHDHKPIDRTEHELSYFEKRVVALTNLLREKGIITLDEVRRAVEEVEARTPAIGARVVAKAWRDPAFKARLLANGKAAIEEMGISTKDINHIVALENTDSVHHVVVCTLCSCYPRILLGEPPEWYKSDAYKSKVVSNPRAVLREWGVELDERVEIRVVDSTADARYLIMPKRPPEADWMSEEELAFLVTRDGMVGLAEALPPKGK